MTYTVDAETGAVKDVTKVIAREMKTVSALSRIPGITKAAIVAGFTLSFVVVLLNL